jgi:hypothetical protein
MQRHGLLGFSATNSYCAFGEFFGSVFEILRVCVSRQRRNISLTAWGNVSGFVEHQKRQR